MKRFNHVDSFVTARRKKKSSNKQNRKMLVESLEGRCLLATINSVESLPSDAGKLLVSYSIGTPSTVPIVFKATQSTDDVSSTDDTVLLTKTVDPSTLGIGTFQVEFSANFGLSDEAFLIFTAQDQGAANPSSSKVFLNDYYVTTDGVVNVFGSNLADNITIANDDALGKFTVSIGALRSINASLPVRGFHVRLYAGTDQFASTINPIVASALTRQSIFAGPDNDAITTYSSNVAAVGGGGVDSILIMGSPSSDQIEVSSQGVVLGGEKRLTMTQFEKLQLDTGNGDDFVVVNSLPAGVTPFFIYNSGTGAVTTSATNDFVLQMGDGRDSLKFTALSTAGNPGSLPWPRIWNTEAIDVSGTSISKLITGGSSLFNAFGTTVERDKLEDLDLRFNQFNLADSAGLQASWALMRSDVPQLKNLLLHGNLNTDTANLYGLRRLWYYIDLPPLGVQQAENQDTQSTVISSLVAALHWNPLKIFEYVRNRIEFEPYYGRKKSPIAVIQSGTGNDYDTANLLRELLIASTFAPSTVQFVQTQSENGSYLYMEHEYARNWLGTMAASEWTKESYGDFFGGGYQPTGVSQSQRSIMFDGGFVFDNLWLEVNDAGIKRLNPSIKQHATSSSQQHVLEQLNSRLGRSYASFGELLAEQVPLNPVSLIKLTGTASAVSNGTTVLGTSTTFTTQLVVGDEIRIGNSYSKVTAVNSATQITVTPSITAAAGSTIYKLPPGQPLVSNDTGFISPYVENPDGYYSLENGDIRRYGVVEWYERRVNDWLAENASGISLADIRRQSPILATQVRSIGDLWPQYLKFGQVSNNTVSFTSSPLVSSWASPASTDFWKIQVLAKYGTGSTQNWWSAPVSYNTADIDQDQLYVRMNGTVPHLFRKVEGASPVQQSTSISPIPNATSFTVEVTSLAPTRGTDLMQPNQVFASSANAIAAGKSNVVAIGVDIGQNSEQLVAKLQLQTNLDQNAGLEQAATVAANTILTSYNADKVGTFVSMVGSVYRRNLARDRESIEGLFGTGYLIGVNVGFFSGFQDVYAGNIDVQKPNPLRITDLTIDLKGQEARLVTANPVSSAVAETTQELSKIYARDFRTSFTLYATQTSALEHLVMEELTDIDAYSTVKLLQIAKKNNVSIVQFNNKAVWDAYKLANPAGTNIVTQSSYASIDAEYGDPDPSKHPETILLPSTNLTVAANVAVYPTTAASSWTGNGYVVQSQRLSGLSGGFKIVDKNGVAHGGKPTNYVFATPAPAVSNISSFINSVADPVNPMTGAFFEDITDINLPSIGLPLHFSRHYDSLTATYATTDRKGGLRDLGDRDRWCHRLS